MSVNPLGSIMKYYGSKMPHSLASMKSWLEIISDLKTLFMNTTTYYYLSPFPTIQRYLVLC